MIPFLFAFILSSAIMGGLIAYFWCKKEIDEFKKSSDEA